MTQAFDERIVRVGIEIDGTTSYYEKLDIRASGRKFTSPINSQCQIRISNLTRETRQYLLTKASPQYFPLEQASRQSVKVTLDVGRVSTGVFRLFSGQVMATGATPPPDIGIVLESITNSYALSLMMGLSLGPQEKLSTIAQAIATQNNMNLEFKVSPENDKLIDNYSFTGPVAKQVESLQQMGGVTAYVDCGIDKDILVVIDQNKLRTDTTIYLSQNTGMISVPQASTQGVVVRCLINSAISLGCGVYIDSIINPAVNGHYKIVQINFELTNRDNSFFYTLLCSNNPLDQAMTI